jgi:hypothetical protein
MIYQFKSVHGVMAFAGLSLMLAACDGSTIYKKSDLGGVRTLSIDAKQRLVLVGTRTEEDGTKTRVVCAEPSPDALVAQAAVLSASGNYKGPEGQPSAGANVGVGLQESASSIGLRTQSIQILRDGYYRLCETYMNGAISNDEYRRVTLNLDTFINVALAIDGLGNAKSAPAVAIGTGPITVNGGAGGDPPTAGTNQLIIGTAPDSRIADAGRGGIDRDSTPIAVAQIVRDFLNYKEDVFCMEELNRKCRNLPTGNIPQGPASPARPPAAAPPATPPKA